MRHRRPRRRLPRGLPVIRDRRSRQSDPACMDVPRHSRGGAYAPTHLTDVRCASIIYVFFLCPALKRKRDIGFFPYCLCYVG